MKIHPVNTKILVKVIMPGEGSGLHLPESVAPQEPVGIVEEAGPDVVSCKAGQRVIVASGRSYEAVAPRLGKNLILLDEKDLLAVIEDEQ